MGTAIPIIDADEAETSFLTFAEEILGMPLYEWQEDCIEPFDYLSEKLVQVSLATPNGSGKSALVIPAIILGTLWYYPKARVILTTADGKQLDGQVMPALEAHRAKFEGWRFLERNIITPTGGEFIGWTTDSPGRAEGWHKISDMEGPLVIIVDEAKTVDEGIFSALDRCTYNALLLASSPGKMSGTFYESQFNLNLDYIRIAVGLKDCPHITQDKIDRIIAKHGPNSPFTRSTLHGEFIEIFDGDPVYYAYSQQVHEGSDLGWLYGATLVVGMDVGTHNASVIAAVKVDSNQRMHVWILREIILTGSDTDRQCVELLKVLATEYPFWNQGLEICPETLFFCDPAARNSAFTSRGPNASALKVIQSHGIYPGMKTAVHLQPSIATVNRLMQQNYTKTIDGEDCVLWQFRIDKDRCPTLARALGGEYRYPAKDQPGYGNDVPLKGQLSNHVDHVCFVAGTMVATPWGERRIETLSVGDVVLTRRGMRKITASGSRIAMVRTYRFSNGRETTSTPDHPYWSETKKRMVQVDKLNSKDILSECNAYTKMSCLMGGFFAAIRTRIDETTEFIFEKLLALYTRPSGSFTTDQSQKDFTSTTRTGIRSITTSEISSVCTHPITSQSTGKEETIAIQATRHIGIALRQERGGMFKQQKRELVKNIQPHIAASNAGRNTQQRFPKTEYQNFDFAPRSARAPTGSEHAKTTWIGRALSALKHFVCENISRRRYVHVVAAGSFGKAKVYNITVEGEHEYFANGLLVSNCDAFRYLVINVLDIAPEQHADPMRVRSMPLHNPEKNRTI